MAVNYDALINQINAEQAKQEQAAREANALLEKQAAAKRDQLMNTYAAQESNQRRNYDTLVDQADKQLTKDGAAAYQSMLVARNPFGTNAERLRNNGMSEYMNTAAYNTYRGDYNNAKEYPRHERKQLQYRAGELSVGTKREQSQCSKRIRYCAFECTK